MEDKLLSARIKVLLIAAYTLCGSFSAVVLALIAGLFAPNELIDNKDVFTLLSYIVTAVAGAITGGYAAMMGFKADKQDAPDMAASVDAPINVSVVNDMDDAPKEEPAPELELTEVVEDDDDDDDDDMAPWEKYRNDMRYDLNGDGVVDENDFPDWRSAGK
jgi:hypothetical protein